MRRQNWSNGRTSGDSDRIAVVLLSALALVLITSLAWSLATRPQTEITVTAPIPSELSTLQRSGADFLIGRFSAIPTRRTGTITTSGDEQIIEQIVKQLRKLVTVVKVVDFYGMAYVEREMMVIKVHAEESKRGEVLRIADIFRCKVVDVSLTDLTLEATGDHSKLQAIIQLLQKFGIKELARTGTLAVRRTMQSDDI